MYRFIIRGRNCGKYVDECLESLRNQTVTDWCGLVIVDPSEDNTLEKLARWIIVDPRIRMVINKEHYGVCRNMWQGLQEIGRAAHPIPAATDEDVVCILDLDDELRYPHTLEIVDKQYRKYPYLLCTYGSFIMSGNGKMHKLCRAYPNNAEGYIRKWRWHASHIKTFKYKIIAHIPPDYFMHKDKWGQGASDLALMFCVMEVAGVENCRFIKDPIYLYRYPTAITCDRSVQKRWRDIFREKKPLARRF
jgi:GT2 family glycosyltransferase